MILLKDLAKYIDINIDLKKEIKGLNTIADANEFEVTFLENKKYISSLKNTKAAAILVTQEFASEVPANTVALICKEPYVSLAYLSKLFKKELVSKDGLKCKLGKNCKIMSNVHLGLDSKIGDNCTIMSGAFIGDNVQIGNNTIIYPNVCIYRDCVLGNDCIIHAGTIIGCDGFGFAQKNGKYIKIYQNGNVLIKDDVEIGSNCTIDRAAFKSTIINSRVRLDNLVHIAHNCILGEGSILVSQVGLSGSTILNEYVVMGGQSGAAGHLEIAPFTTIAARGGVTKSIKEPKKQWAGFPLMEHRTWLRLQAKISKLLK